MTATIQDVLQANVVLVGLDLLNTPAALDAFREAVNSEIAQEGVLLTQSQNTTASQGKLFRIAKERISIEASPVRFAVNRDYPNQEDLARLAEITSMAIEHTDIGTRTPSAFGFNVELVFDQSSGNSAFAYLGTRLFSSNLDAETNWRLVGGSGRLVFEENSHRWTVRIEPRLNDESTTKVFLSLNSHFDELRLPDKEEMYSFLKATWERALGFVERID